MLIDIVGALGSFVLLGFFAGAVGDLVADSDLFAPVRERADEASTWLGDLVSCRFCVSAWGAMFGWALLQYTDTLPGLEAILVVGAAWKLSTILRGMNE